MTAAFLDHLGITWERIPEEADRRADFRAADLRCQYLFEVKQRDDDREHREYEAALLTTGQAVLQQPIDRRNRVSGLITTAAAQLQATPAATDTLRIMVFVAAGRDLELQEAQLFATFYGAVDLITNIEHGRATAKPCFYMAFSDAYRLADIDGVLTLADDRARLLLNAFSVRLDVMRRSVLFQKLEESGAVVDPPTMEAAGEGYIADCDLDRRDRHAVLQYVKAKYQLQTALTFEPTLIKSAVIVPRPESDH